MLPKSSHCCNLFWSLKSSKTTRSLFYSQNCCVFCFLSSHLFELVGRSCSRCSCYILKDSVRCWSEWNFGHIAGNFTTTIQCRKNRVFSDTKHARWSLFQKSGFASFIIFFLVSLNKQLPQPLVRCCFRIVSSSKWMTSVGVENGLTNLQREGHDQQTHRWLMLESNTVALIESVYIVKFIFKDIYSC